MLKEKNNFLQLVFGGIFCIGVLNGGSPKLIVYGQTSADSTVLNAPSSAKIPQIARERIVVNKTASVAPLILPTAKAENVKFQNTLQWNFGAKRQRGWYLYVSLIQHTIGSESGTGTPEFARAVALWQQEEGIYPTGTINRETLLQMIEYWQSRRLNSSIYAAPEDLLTAPIADFYDPTREVELLRVERETYHAYKQMVAAAAAELKLKTDINGKLLADEKYLRIISAFRSREYQAKLRAAAPQSGRAGLAVNSPHFTGRTLDIYVGGEPTITKYFNRALQVQTPVYKWLVKNASRFGFYPYFYEPWHWEYVPQNPKSYNIPPLTPKENINAPLP
jgi:uncharacterized protein YcbK (DUF882 family)